MVFVFLLALAVTSCIYLLWKNIFSVSKYWELYGIPQVPSAYPIFGHMWPVVLQRTHNMDLTWKWYEEYKNHSMVGFNDAGTPALLIRDPEIIKDVLQTKFEHFAENGYKVDRQRNPSIYGHPSFNTGQEWVTHRKRMTYAFSQKNMNVIGEYVIAVCEKFHKYLRRRVGAREKLELEMKSLAARFMAEVSANTTFGVEGSCFDEVESPVSFYAVMKSIFEMESIAGEAFLLLYPKIAKILPVQVMKQWVLRRFETILKSILAERANGVLRSSTFLDIVINLNPETIAEKDMPAVAFSFIADTYETTNIVASFTLYELARHPDIQQKLREELKALFSKYPELRDRLTYKAAKELQYTEQVIHESMRLHPQADLKYRVCTRECHFKGYDGLSCRVKPGTEIFISSLGLQYDPEYWTDPWTFNPDRFASGNLPESLKFVYMPFCEGPRKCVGMKLGIFAVKSIIHATLRDYVLELSPRTKVPVELDPRHNGAVPLHGMWVYLKPISKS